MTTQEALIESTINREALLARLCATFAGLALAIAVVGLYGTVLHDVSRRRAEIGVRMALGARQGQVVSMVLREVAVVVAIGLAAGVPAALSATKISEALLFGVRRGDPGTTAIAMTVLVATALVSAFTPALGAARVNPTVALRNE
jgi:ABC-type antimicrobial peptide transport system permease subunit